MNAVFYTADVLPWVADLGNFPWALLPVANRPLLDYWLETCAEQKVAEVQIVLGDGAKLIEDFAGDGSRWGVKINYSFARTTDHPSDYLKAAVERSDDGVIYIGRPFFLRRRKAFTPSVFEALEGCRYKIEDDIAFLYGRTLEEVTALLDGSMASGRGLEKIHINPFPIDGTSTYFDLNMKMVGGEYTRYLTAGFPENEGNSIGYNVVTPPSAHLVPPIMIGNDCRFGAMTTIGPRSVIGDHVIVDAHTEMMNCLILPDTYIGKNLEIRNKIVSGDKLVCPDDGTAVQITDSWLLARNRPDMRTEDLVRYVILWILAGGVWLVQLLPFLLVYSAIRIVRAGAFRKEMFHDPQRGYMKLPTFHQTPGRRSALCRIFRVFSLDRFPRLTLALRGRLFVCGQPPMRHPEDDGLINEVQQYYPAVYSYADYCEETDRLVDSLWYAHIRSLFEDIKILVKALTHRLLHKGG